MTSHSSRYTYNTIFSDICKTRFNHLVTRLLLIITVVEALFITLLSSKRNGQQFAFSIIENIFLFFPKVIVLYFVSVFIIITRKNYLHVDSLGYSSFGTQLLGQIFAFKFVAYHILYTLGSLALALTMGDMIFIGSANYSRWESLYYRQYVWLIIPFVYNLQHNIFDMDKLVFIFDKQFQLPQLTISSNISFIISRCVVMSLFILISTPFVSVVTTGYWLIGFGLSFKLFVLTFLILFHFEFTNLCFNAHMTMGCLHKGKPVSSLSSTPMETLITGLQSKKSFTKLTAFQELAYRATSHDATLRFPIYNNGSSTHSTFKKYNVWFLILNECLKVINDSNTNVADYLVALEQTTTYSTKSQLNEEMNKSRLGRINEDTEILFGNKPTNGIQEEIKGVHVKRENGDNRNILSPYNVSSDGRREPLLDGDNLAYDNQYSRHNPKFIDTYDKYNESILTHDTKFTKMIKLLWSRSTNYFTTFFFPITGNNNDINNNNKTSKNVSLSLFEIWYLSKERRAEKLIPVPIYHAESIIAMMGFLINGIDESPRGTVVASVGDVLKALERSVGILGKYADWNPNGVKTSNETDTLANDNINVISILYEFSISAFLEIVLKYNVLLNDVILDEDVVRLSKWVLSMCEST